MSRVGPDFEDLIYFSPTHFLNRFAPMYKLYPIILSLWLLLQYIQVLLFNSFYEYSLHNTVLLHTLAGQSFLVSFYKVFVYSIIHTFIYLSTKIYSQLFLLRSRNWRRITFRAILWRPARTTVQSGGRQSRLYTLCSVFL